MRLAKILIIILAVLAVAMFVGHDAASQLLGQQIVPQHLIGCDGLPGPCPS